MRMTLQDLLEQLQTLPTAAHSAYVYVDVSGDEANDPQLNMSIVAVEYTAGVVRVQVGEP